LLGNDDLLPFAAQAQQPNTPGETEKLCKEDCEKSCMGNDTPTERAKCLERENCGNRPACPTKGRGASFFIRRGMDEIRIKCADSDSTRACIDVIRPIISPGGGHRPLSMRQPASSAVTRFTRYRRATTQETAQWPDPRTVRAIALAAMTPQAGAMAHQQIAKPGAERPQAPVPAQLSRRLNAS
jgi:hypothetical protein